MVENNEHGQPQARSELQLSVRKRLAGPSGPFDLSVDLQVQAGSLVVLAGPSGAGKTTLLRLIAGFDRPDAGGVRFGNAVWSDIASGAFIPVRKRPVGFVFQDYALFPNMTVRGNVEYALGRRYDRTEAMRLLELVRLEGLAAAWPTRLSGGQKQRLALIRAVARRPKVLMLDEPLSALDPDMRGELQEEVRRLHREFGTTSIMVSHDSIEIARMADRVVRLEAGKVVFDGSPSSAFASGAGQLKLRATLLAGPDVSGHVSILLDGRTVSVRLPVTEPHLTPGQEVEVDLAATAIRPA